MPETVEAPRRSSTAQWYAKHKTEHNEKRRTAYANTPVLRKEARERAAQYRQSRRDGKTVERSLVRVVNGSAVRVYTTGEVADHLGCSAQMIRNWESRGWIPAPVLPDSHRLYFKHQVEMIRRLYLKLAKGTGKSRLYKNAVVESWKNSIMGKW